MAEGGDTASNYSRLATCYSGDNKNDFSLNNLRDELLIEILRRLPTAKSVLGGCNQVCKRWRSLIATPYFVSKFVEYHQNQNNNSYYPAYQHPPSSFVNPLVTPGLWYESNTKLHFVIGGDEDAIFQSHGYSLEFLPETRQFVSVVASCNDLFLCRAVKNDDYKAYYVCNPLTKQWFLLPRPQPPIIDKTFNIKFGLVYDFNYERYECRFRVVFINNIATRVYCSETEQHWNEFALGKGHRPCSGNIVAFDGKLFWCIADHHHVIAYDPFENETVLIDGSDEHRSRISENKEDGFLTSCLSICQGTLRVMRWETHRNQVDNAIAYLTLWELKDFESRRLTLKQRIFLNSECSLAVQVPRAIYLAQPLGFHPTEDDEVCVGLMDSIITCKIQGEDLEVVGKATYECRLPLLRCDFKLTTMHPWWPTPVSNCSSIMSFSLR